MSDSHPGLGVMLAYLGGNEESVAAWKSSLGRKIVQAELIEGGDAGLRITLEDRTAVVLYDAGQSCCEHRYMRTDDNLAEQVGAVLLDAEIRDAPNIATEDSHEVQFLVIKTDRGSFTLSSHNEHNGYYGGFAITARKEFCD